MPYTMNDLPDGSGALAGCFTARDYYGGQFTALYALSSSGSLELYPGEGLGRICRELAEAIRCAETQGEWEDASNLAALRDWCVDTMRAAMTL